MLLYQAIRKENYMLTNEELNKKILEFEQTSAIEGGNPWAIYKCAKDVK